MPELFPYTIVRRRVKYARLELTPQGLKIVVPNSPRFDIDTFLDRHKTWIKRKIVLYQQLSDGSYKVIQRRDDEFKRLVREYVALACAAYDAKYQSIIFRTMKNRWGSCSNRGELKFNNNLSYLPDELIRYVVYHEVCHLRVLNHSLQFKRLLSGQFSDVKLLDRQLLGYWQRINKQRMDRY